MRKNNKLQINKWVDYSFKLSNKILSENNLRLALSNFWKDVIDPLRNTGDSSTLLIQFKVKAQGNIYRSISYIQIINFKDFNKIFKIFNSFLNHKKDNYQSWVINEMIFNYKILDHKIKSKFAQKKVIRPSIHNDIITNPFNNLPNNMDIKTWGDITYSSDETEGIIIIKDETYKIKFFNKSLETDVFIEETCIFSFKDEKLNVKDLSTFKRTIYNPKKEDKEKTINTILFYNQGKIEFKKVLKPCNFIEPLHSKAKTKIQKSLERAVNLLVTNINQKFITMDIETRELNGVLSPVAICFYDGSKSFSFYITDYKSSDNMLEEAIKSIMIEKYADYKIYLHNFSNFDSIFLLRALTNLSDDIAPIIRDNRIIDLRFNYPIKNKFYNLYFRDSYLLLNASLDKLCKEFNTETVKDIFPFDFVNSTNVRLNYKGSVPSIKHFDKITLEEYKAYSNRFAGKWDLKQELLNYCNKDCISLWQVLYNFSIEIWELFQIDISKYPTTPSLAFGVFRKNYLKHHKIPIITGNMYNDLVQAYYGGRTEMFIPTNNPGEKIFAYDVNSLYPNSMDKYYMPTGQPYYFEGDVLKYNKDPFGFFEVEITTPDIEIPLLPFKRFKTSYSSIVFPTGKWKGWYSSIELNKAKELGYNIKILRGYLFSKKNIFAEYVNDLYIIKNNSSKGSAKYTISKLLLNSLYGRFGMSPFMEKHIIVNEDKSNDLYHNQIVVDRIPLNNGKELISLLVDKKDDDNNLSSNINISVSISAMITAASRLRMYEYFEIINNNDAKLFYTDTDSAYTNKPLPDKYIGNGLGLMKLEGVFDEVVFLAPKVYGLKNNSKEIVKVKGLKNPIKFDELKSLLMKDSKLVVKQNKWYKSYTNANITIKKELYTLMVTDNKRKLIYHNNILTSTKPFNI